MFSLLILSYMGKNNCAGKSNLSSSPFGQFQHFRHSKETNPVKNTLYKEGQWNTSWPRSEVGCWLSVNFPHQCHFVIPCLRMVQKHCRLTEHRSAFLDYLRAALSSTDPLKVYCSLALPSRSIKVSPSHRICRDLASSHCSCWLCRLQSSCLKLTQVFTA